MNFQFLKFDATPGEKHIGIATIRIEISGSRIILRFKIVPKEHGGYYCQPASYKVGTINGKDQYVPSFALDSTYEADELRNFILANIETITNVAKVPAQQNPNFNQNAQQPYPHVFNSSPPQPVEVQEELPF